MGATFTNLLCHVVFSTKNRSPLITNDLRNRLYEYMGGIIRAEKGVQLCIGGIQDHVHILCKYRPDRNISDIMRVMKANSSRWMNEQGAGGFAWQAGYAAFSVSESQIDAVARYIAGQAEHHRARTFKEELTALLDRHHIAYDDRYIWD